eukprot:2381636-Pyramimonas_sp.AAC.2
MGLLSELMDLIIAVFATGRTRRNYHARQTKKRSAFKKNGGTAIFWWFKFLFSLLLLGALLCWAVSRNIELPPLDEEVKVSTDFEMLKRKLAVFYAIVTYQDRPRHKPVTHETTHGSKMERVMSREHYGELVRAHLPVC